MRRYVKHEKSKECVSMWIKLNNKNNYKFIGLKVEDTKYRTTISRR